MIKLWGAKMEVNVDHIIHNITAIQQYLGPGVEIIPVIKDNGYGTKINDRLDIFTKTKTKMVAVAIVDEGVYLRECGYNGDIFVLNQPLEAEIPAIARYKLIMGIGAISFLNKLGQYPNHTFKIHMEIGTGMGRTGINPNRALEYLQEAQKYPNIIIDGIYTHFSSSDCDEEYTRAQINSFNRALAAVQDKLPHLRYIHCCNSAGIINFPEAHFNAVRPGLLLYGYYPTEELRSRITVKPVIKLKSKISFIKEVKEGISIGYGRSYITSRTTKVATVPLGYADGIRRSLSNKGQVVINGQLAPIIGTICMDCFMVDVTDLAHVQVEDDVFIWDNEKITVEDIANLYGTINYEVISTISDRVIREYISAENGETT
ncbi:MAG: alanine racemase [Peptococcia bacterium]